MDGKVKRGGGGKADRSPGVSENWSWAGYVRCRRGAFFLPQMTQFFADVN
jgi:hypothetical protein